MQIGELGEFRLLAELERLGLVETIADDGAVLDGGRVLTQDILIEGVHFRSEWIPWRDLGYKAAAVNLSDLAAMGAEPEALLVTLALPGHVELEHVFELYEGLNEPGVAIVGGDTSTGPQIAVSVTAVGRSGRVPGRSGARAGDVLVVTGPLGAAAAGLDVLRGGLSGFDHLVRSHNRPPFRLDAARLLAPIAHALIDLSDGIASDAARIAERSHCRLVIEVESVPKAPGLESVGEAPYWTMGEDYELLAAMSPADASACEFPVVGRCTEGSGVQLLLNGQPIDVSGWDHFRRLDRAAEGA